LEARADRSIDAHVALFTQASRSIILFEYPDEWWDGVALSAPLTSEVLGVEGGDHMLLGLSVAHRLEDWVLLKRADPQGSTSGL
jgi:hypothetical protein